MAQMPPQAGPPGPGAPPPPAGADQAPDDKAEGGDKSVTDTIVEVDTGLSQLAALIGKAQGVDPSVKQMMNQALEAYRGAIKGIMGTKEGGGGAEPVQGQTPMQAGGNPNAVPAM